MKHRPLVFLDIETTGGSPTASRVLEVGAVRVENNKIVSTFSQLVQPEEEVPWWITKITGITNEMVWDAPIFRSIADDLELFMSDAIFVAHNVNFDYSFIKEEYRKLGNTFAMDRLCTVRLSRLLYPEQRRHNLDSVIAAHNISVNNRHRALDDAKVMVEFFNSSLKQHGLAVYEAMDKLLTTSTTS